MPKRWELFSVLRYLGAGYLIWLGYSLIRSPMTLERPARETGCSSLIVSALAGLALTLRDLKAILFYASLFPSLFDVAALSGTDTTLIITITVLTVGGVKAIYAVAARSIVEGVSKAPAVRPKQTIAGGILMGTGIYFIAGN